MSVFQSAIVGDDGRVDAGYLALYWTMAVTVTAIPILVLLGIIAALRQPDKAAEIIQATGIAIGAVCTGAGVVIGAVGAFRMGDKQRPAPGSSVITERSADALGSVEKVTEVGPPVGKING